MHNCTHNNYTKTCVEWITCNKLKKKKPLTLSMILRITLLCKTNSSAITWSDAWHPIYTHTKTKSTLFAGTRTRSSPSNSSLSIPLVSWMSGNRRNSKSQIQLKHHQTHGWPQLMWRNKKGNSLPSAHLTTRSLSSKSTRVYFSYSMRIFDF